MEIIIQPTAEEASRLAARVVANKIKAKPSATLGLPTGRTPLVLYRELIRLHKEEGLDFSSCSTFNLDEYVGLAPDNKNSYNFYMRDSFFKYVNIDLKNTHCPDGMTDDIVATCQAYEDAIEESGGIDLQVLGIGSEGHIGFNEPTSSLASRTRIKTLTAKTVQDNTAFFGSVDAVPKHVITMGIGTIMQAKEVILLAFGRQKASVVAKTIEGPVTAMVPASVLQHHPHVKFFIDEEAAAELKLKPYYTTVFNNKPKWQQF